MKTLLLIVALTVPPPAVAQSKDEKLNGPDCSGRWPTIMTLVHLKNAGLADNSTIDFSKTKMSRLASQKIGKALWHQVYYVRFTKTSGDVVEAIAIHDASTEECSMSGVEVFRYF